MKKIKTFFKKIFIKLSLKVLKGRFGEKMADKLNIEIDIKANNKLIFTKKLDKEDLIKIFENQEL